MAEAPLRDAYTEAALEELLDIEVYLEAQRQGLGEMFRAEKDDFEVIA